MIPHAYQEIPGFWGWLYALAYVLAEILSIVSILAIPAGIVKLLAAGKENDKRAARIAVLLMASPVVLTVFGRFVWLAVLIVAPIIFAVAAVATVILIGGQGLIRGAKAFGKGLRTLF